MKNSLHKSVSPNTLNLIPWSEIVKYRDGNLFWKPGLTRNQQDKSSHQYPTNRPIGGKANHKGYVFFSYKKKRFGVHQVVWALHHGPIPSGMTVDHADRNPANNRIENLRLATNSQQCANTKKYSAYGNNPSRWKGLSSHRNTGHWRLFVKGQYLGLFPCEFDAATAYNFFAAEEFGSFACLNSVPQPWLEEP